MASWYIVLEFRQEIYSLLGQIHACCVVLVKDDKNKDNDAVAGSSNEQPATAEQPKTEDKKGEAKKEEKKEEAKKEEKKEEAKKEVKKEEVKAEQK